MTGRLDAVDLPADVVLLAAARHDGPIPFDTLVERVTTADVADVPFDTPDADTIIDAVAMFRQIGFVDVDTERGTVALTDPAVAMANHLADHEPDTLFPERNDG